MRAVALLVIFGLCHDLSAGSFDVTVKDGKGALVSDAVVYARGNGMNAQSTKKQTAIDQQDKQFIPYVTAVQVGTSILFPNKDNIRHHVYSLSSAKKFELPLYKGVPAEPVVFDKEGFVTLGCNIHDWMIAYVAVLGTPHFQVTGREGHALLKNLPPGQYTVEVWQPSLKGAPATFAQHVDVAAGGMKQLLFTLDLKPGFRVKRAAGFSTGGYR
ncbi:MAG TPA: methylamine utilization protein [Candidatus Udaeobacter sp.]|jgi:plastocyanin|nr:methylamine utilization protein [Candidatus Udaeobacter sp.]